MASPHQSELSYAWEKYMDCRLQGADLQVGFVKSLGVSHGAGDAYFCFPGMHRRGSDESICFHHF